MSNNVSFYGQILKTWFNIKIQMYDTTWFKTANFQSLQFLIRY